MTVTTGPNIGLLINAEIGEEYYAALTNFLRGVDGLVQPRVGDKDLSAPPDALANGVMYIVGPNPTGAWAGKAGQLARWFSVGTGSPAWEFYAPKLGWSVRVLDELDSNGVAKEYVYGSAGWVVPAGGSGGGGVAETYTVIAPTAGALNLSNPATTIWGVNLNANVTTVTLPSGLSAPTGITLIITQDSTGGRTIAWPSNVTWNGAAPTIKSTANGKTMLGLLTVDGGATWLGTSIPVSSGGGGGMVNPMTAKGSLIVGGTAGTAEELLAGAAGQVLTVSSTGTLVWTTPSGGGGGGDFKSDGSVPLTGGLKYNSPIPTVDIVSFRADIYAISSAVCQIAGGGGILNSFAGGAPSTTRRVIFTTSGLRIQHSANASARIECITGADIIVTAGDIATFVCLESFVWKMIGYQKADGTALVAAGGGGDFKADGSVRMTGPVNEAPAVTLNVTGSTASIYPVAGNTIALNATGNIESFGEAPAGITRRIYFQNAMTLKRSSILETLTNADIVTRLGDWAQMYSNGGGFWVMMDYTRKDGTPLVAPSSVDTTALDLAGTRTMTGPVNEAPIRDLPAYSTTQPTTDLGGTSSNVVNLIAWDASVTSFGTAPKGFRRTVVRTGFNGNNAGQDTGPVTLVHNATSLRLPNNGQNITTSIGDSFEMVSLGEGRWFCEWYQKANGRALVADGFTEDQVRATLLTGLAAATGDVVATDSILVALGKLQATKVAKVDGKGLSTNDYTSADQSKLAAIQNNATANSLDSFLLARANHTGTQAIATVSGLQAALDAKVNAAALQTSQTDRTADTILKLGAFGIGKFLDFRPLGITGATPPSAFFSTGTMSGFINGGNTSGEAGLSIPALGAVLAYGVLTVQGHWSDATGGGGVQQIFTTGDRVFSRLPASATTWKAWREQAFTDNAVFTGASTRFVVEAVRHDPGGTVSAGYEIGSTGGASTPYLDFHSGAVATDYDFRLLFSGGDGTVGRGNAAFNGNLTTFNCLTKFTNPVEYPNYTLSTLPSAAAHSSRVINVSNATGGQKLCQSDGNSWKILNTGNTVS